MPTTKLIVSHKRRLTNKYGAKGVKAIEDAISAMIATDKERGIATRLAYIDDSVSMKSYRIAPIKDEPTALKCKKTIDKIFSRLSPDYLVLLGSQEIIPHFLVDNPSFHDSGDDDEKVPTDNPYACSESFSHRKRATYLIPDRVIGRIPDLPGSDDPSWLLDYLKWTQRWKPTTERKYKGDLFVCCKTWSRSGKSCATYLSRKASRLMVSPPTEAASRIIRGRHRARLHMIKCHGVPLDASFYGQSGNKFPIALTSASLLNRTRQGTLVGAMCCYGAAVFDPNDPAAATPGAPPISSVYLRQGACGFVGSTTISWVGSDDLICADWIITLYLEAVLKGASIGRALLDAKQQLVQKVNQQGRQPDIGEEKTLLQFLLLGDPSIHVIASSGDGAVNGRSGRRAAAVASEAVSEDRRARRIARRETGEQLRAYLPGRKRVKRGVPPSSGALKEAAKLLPDIDPSNMIVQEVQPPSVRPRRVMAVAGAAATQMVPVVSPSTLEYYWVCRNEHQKIIDARMVKVETDKEGEVLRTQLLFSC